MLTDIQYFAAHYVAFKDNLEENDKVNAIEWIKSSSDDQIKSLLIKGNDTYCSESVKIFDKAFPMLIEAVTYDVPGYFKSLMKTGVFDMTKFRNAMYDLSKQGNIQGQGVGLRERPNYG